jgi:HlyD family secretion protein
MAHVDTARAEARAADASVSAARADVTLARASVDQSQANLAYTKIVSPIDGVVVSRNVNIGQTVAASLSAPTLFVLAEDLQKMELHTNVAEADVGQIATGQKVEFTVDAFPSRTFEGTVKQVRYAAQTVSNVVTYDAVVLVGNQDLSLRPGMTANATFVIAEKKDVLTIPSAAMRYRPANAQPPPRGPRGRGGPRTIYVLRGGEPQPVQVKLGLSDGSVTEVAEVVEGQLAPGDLIITGDGSAPQQGDPGQTPRRQGGRRGGPPRVL